MFKISDEFKQKYKLVKDKNIREKIKDSLGIQFQLDFLRRKLKERKSWLNEGTRS
jgi:hypothetical protein